MNPYEVLGVSRDATDEEIKAAYRKLVKKYHPDRYASDPEKQAAASEKLKQVNAAYDMITKMKQGGYSAAGSGSPEFTAVRMAIQRNDLMGAEAMLNRMTEHPAEWHFLMGVVLFRRGWYDGAEEHFNMAYRMEPNNQEYEQAMRSMQQMTGAYMDFGTGDGDGRMNNRTCQICASCACIGCAAASMFRCLPCFCCI